jgi:hypothetical protein
MIIVYGAKGNMGRRYMAILKFLGVERFGVDVDTPPESIPHERAAGYIVATPTESHVRFMRVLLKHRRPILCEKPWSLSIEEVRKFAWDLTDMERRLVSMVAQYRQLLPRLTGRGPTVYDYYKHGDDGLAWDCIQPIAFSNGPATLREESPIWTCKINGYSLSLGDMDWAYVKDIQGWLSGDNLDVGFILNAHEKTHEVAEKMKRAGA